MSPVGVEVGCLSVGFPRVSGDEPRQRRNGARAIMFSPRERG